MGWRVWSAAPELEEPPPPPPPPPPPLMEQERLGRAGARLPEERSLCPTLAMGWRVWSAAPELEELLLWMELLPWMELLLRWKELEPLAPATEKPPTPWPSQALRRCP